MPLYLKLWVRDDVTKELLLQLNEDAFVAFADVAPHFEEAVYEVTGGELRLILGSIEEEKMPAWTREPLLVAARVAAWVDPGTVPIEYFGSYGTKRGRALVQNGRVVKD